MNKNFFRKSFAIIALMFSALTLVEGTKVLFGFTQQDYFVYKPLLIYNVIMGLVGIIVSIIIWFNKKNVKMFPLMVSLLHLTILIVVVFNYLTIGTIAFNSVKAMIVRTSIWIVVALVVMVTTKLNNSNQ